MANKNLQKMVDEVLASSGDETSSDVEEFSGFSSSDDNSDVGSELDECEQEDFSQEEDDGTCTSDIESNREYNNECDEIWHENIKPIPSFTFNESWGIRDEINRDISPLMIFQKLFNEDVINLLVSSHNAYGKYLENNDPKPSTRKRPKTIFPETSKDEMLTFLGLCLLQGQNKKPSIRKLFSKNILYYQPIFGAVMSGRRFQQILRCFSCHASYQQDNHAGKLEKVMPLLHLVLTNFKKTFTPGKDLSLDESLMLFRGRLSFKQYNKGKRARYGIKFYELTTKDGYILNVKIYAGKDVEETSGSKTKAVVLKLMEPYLNRGHHLYMDNYYNSVDLSHTLLSYKTHSTGTLRSNRKPSPKCIVSKKLAKGEMIWRRTGNVYVTKWKDKRDVLSITTAHHPCLIEVTNSRGQKKIKPVDVAAYNENMAGIDRADQLLSYYSSPRKTIRWYKKVLFHILDMAVWNSFFIYKTFHPKKSFLHFRDDLILSLLNVPANVAEGKDLVNLVTASGRPQKTRNETCSIDMTIHHFPEKIPFPLKYQGSSKNKSYQKICQHCLKNGTSKATSFQCKNCVHKPALCPDGCFESYHLK